MKFDITRSVNTSASAMTKARISFGGATTAQYNFRPADVTIHPGDTVIWSNSGGTHTVTGSESDAVCGSGDTIDLRRYDVTPLRAAQASTPLVVFHARALVSVYTMRRR